MKISVIMPVYNVESYLRQSLESVLSQTYTDIELIIINDGSDDNSDKIIKSYQQKDQRIKYLYQRNQGVSAARNLALSMVSGQYVFFMDADDVLEENSFQRLALHLRCDAPDILFFGYIMDSLKTGKKIEKVPSRTSDLTRNEFILNFDKIESEVDINSLWNKAYSITFLKKINAKFSKMTIGEDALFNYYCFKNFKVIKIIKEVYYHYSFERSGSAMNTFNTRRLLQKLEVVKEYDNLRTSFHIKSKCKIQEKLIGIFFGEIKSIMQNKEISLQTKDQFLRQIKYQMKKKGLLKFRTFNEINTFKEKTKFLFCIVVLNFIKGDKNG